jgi:phage terminase large subunit-like protein
MAGKLDDYLDLITFVRDQTIHLGVAGFWVWLADQDEEFREAIIGVMQDPAFALEDHQLMPRILWRIWFLRMGRGAGKTHSASANTNLLAKYVYPGGYGILVGPTVQHVRETMIDGPSGLIATAPVDCIPEFRPHYNRVEWPNGTRCMIMTADNPQGIRGPSLNFGWGDELTKWKHSNTFDNLFRAVREKHVEGTKLILTTSPIRAQEWVKAIEDRPNTIVSTASSMQNIHQDEHHLAELEAEAKIGGTKAREEILGEWTSGESQLWSRDSLDLMRIKTTLGRDDYAATCNKRFLSVDPSGGKDETGIIYGGEKRVGKRQVHILDDFSGQMSLEAAYTEIVRLAKLHLVPGDYILFEENNQLSGPALLREMLKTAVVTGVRVIPIHAQKSKYARAEEAYMHSQLGKVKLLGDDMPKMERQLVEWEPDLKHSPDRGDAFTQAVKHVLGEREKRQFQVISLGRA